MPRMVFALCLAASWALAAACGQAFTAGASGAEDGGPASGDATIEASGGSEAGGGEDATDAAPTGQEGAPPDGGIAADGSSGDAAGPTEASLGDVIVVGSEGGTVDAAGCPTGQVCAPPVPPGWLGPVSLLLGTGTAPSCPPSMNVVFDAGAQLEAGAAVCSTCTCTAQGASCSLTLRVFGADAGCSSAAQPCAQGSPAPGGACAAVGGTCPKGGWLAQAEVTGSASPCVASTENATTPPASWGVNAVGCEPQASVVCSSGGTCLPSGPRQCIYAPGAGIECPDAGYVTPHAYFTAVQDGRGCTPCTCGTPEVTCTGAANVSVTASAGSCSLGTQVPASGACTAVNLSGVVGGNTPYAQYEGDAAPTASASCPADGGQAVGDASAANPITVCCAP